MLKKTKLIIGIVVGVVGIGLFTARGLTDSPNNRPHFALSELTVTHSDGKAFLFKVEVATSLQEQAYGLMFIKELPEKTGMIFPYNPPREIAFWMKNTLIPLDMLFIRPDHTIGRIVANARPQDLTPIPSLGPVCAVIEINGGLAKKYGLEVGDKVDSPILPQS